jgi:hypothetical protein
MPKSVTVPRGAGDEVLARIRVPLMQRGSITHQGAAEELFIVDLGLAGVFVERREPLAVGAIVEVRFRLPRNDIPVTARCRVAWWHPEGDRLLSKSLPPGLGLAFVEISKADLGKIRDELRDQFRREPQGRRFSRPWFFLDDEGGPT